MVGLGGRGSLFTHLKTEKAITEENVARRSLSVEQSPEAGKLSNGYWLPYMGNLSDVLTKVRRDLAPLSGPLESEKFSPRPCATLKEYNRRRTE